MDPILGGSLITAGSSILGGLLGQNEAKKQNAQQYDLARNSIKYRVQDAKNAGIHPLYALGAPTLSSSHVTSPMGQSVANAGKALSNIGQNKLSNKLLEAQIEGQNIGNKRAAWELNKMVSDSTVVRPTPNPKLIPNHVLTKGKQYAPKFSKTAFGGTLFHNPNRTMGLEELHGDFEPQQMLNMFEDYLETLKYGIGYTDVPFQKNKPKPVRKYKTTNPSKQKTHWSPLWNYKF